MSRAARLAFRRDHSEPGLEILSDLLELDSNMASWTALEIVQNTGNLRDIDLVFSLLALVGNDSTTAEAAWDLEPKSWLAYGDISEALKSYSGLLDQALTSKQRGEVLGAVASLKMQLGDSLGAQTAYMESFEIYPEGPTAAEAAWALMELEEEVEKDWMLDWAEVLEDQREYHRALVAYDRYVLLAPDSVRDSPDVQMVRAGLL